MEHSEIEILLIEDNLEEAELTLRTLKKHVPAHKLLHIDDGEEAIDYIFSKGEYADNNISVHPKLILLDLKLPKVDGLEILREIKTNEKTKTIPVTILTSSKEEKDIIESYKLGVNSYIVKPVNSESFTKAVSVLGLYWSDINQQPAVDR